MGVQQGNCGNFTEAQQMLSAAEGRLRPASSPVSAMLVQQLHEARDQLEDRAVFERRGRSMMYDACQMHSVQRCTNSKLSAMQGMYLKPQQSRKCQQAASA